ncbi:MAG: primary-amine oxidase [Acidobacteria bacterium]|nr:primary-amine oxidase [Acidobacteriota bacterium]
MYKRWLSTMWAPVLLAQPPGPALHPLSPLTSAEITAAVEILKAAAKTDGQTRFSLLALQEPPKAAMLRYRPGDAVERRVFAILQQPQPGKVSEAVVDLAARKLVSFRDVPGAQPMILLSDINATTGIVRADPGWQAAMRKRGITDFDQIQIDPWSAGMEMGPEEKGRRIVRGVSHYLGTAKNAYARPIEGVVAYVDLNERRVFKLIDTGVVPVPRATADFDEASVGPLRAAPRPLDIRQPRGPSFEVDGNEVRWQNWRFRFSVHPREGLVLHTVSYQDQGRPRSVLHRASLSEMYVPYGDPSQTWVFRNVFDEGEYGVGKLFDSLAADTDVPSNAVLFDSVFADDAGKPYVQPRTVALYERDGGLLWKHQDFESGVNQSRRARDLVLHGIATVGNYDYGFAWVFHQDGSLELEAQLTGIMQPKAVSGPHAAEEHAHLVAPNIAAPHHQHFFNFRLDLDVDGAGSNRVVEIDTAPQPPGPDNPSKTGMLVRRTILRTEREAQREVSMASSRKWKIESTSARNALGQATGYLLVPGENSVPMAAPDSWYRKRAGFVNHHLWVTPFEESERNAAGAYPNQTPGNEGLPRWVKGNRSIENTDVVVWYTFGVTHIPRPEEWPVMPVHRAGFKLLPAGFFSRNPALDVPVAATGRE